MKLAKVEIKNYRSLFADADHDVFKLDLGEGMNALVGPNNTGKSNFLRAVALALDPDHPFDREMDMPGALMYAFPRVTLEFLCEGKTAPEKTLVKRAEAYERSLLKAGRKTYAQDGIVRFQVSFPGNERFGATRQEILVIRGAGARQGDAAKLERAVQQFRHALRFVMIESGQSLEGVLAGKFKEILRSVIREHLREEFTRAEDRRQKYVEGLQTDLLAPLTDRILEVVSSLFQEVSAVSLEPDVPDIDTTLSNVGISLQDAMLTPLGSKGTGVRGAVMVAMLKYLAERSRRSMVFAIEEPEAFLHPAAQEDLRNDLESLAERPDVTLLMSTHSPYVISRDAKARLFALTKDGAGRTTIVAQSNGNEPHAPLVGGLFRDSMVSEILDRATQIPASALGVVFVEGTTDASYIALAARVAKRPDLLEGLCVIPAGGASKLVLAATIARAQTGRPVLALLDADATGRSAMDTLKSKLGFQASQVFSYAEMFGGNAPGIEAEDLFPLPLLKRFIKKEGEDKILSEKTMSPHLQRWHFGFNALGKDLIVPFLARQAKVTDMGTWISLIEQIRTRMGL